MNSVTPATGEAAGKPERLAHWSDFGPLSPTMSADGKRLSFLKTRGWQDAYLAELTREGTIRSAPRRFTLDNRGSYPNAWTPDSQGIIFSSDRTARRAIFKQALIGTVAQAVIQSPGDDCDEAVLTPDRSWILFRAACSVETECLSCSADAAACRRWSHGNDFAGASRSAMELCVRLEGGVFLHPFSTGRTECCFLLGLIRSEGREQNWDSFPT